MRTDQVVVGIGPVSAEDVVRVARDGAGSHDYLIGAHGSIAHRGQGVA